MSGGQDGGHIIMKNQFNELEDFSDIGPGPMEPVNKSEEIGKLLLLACVVLTLIAAASVVALTQGV